MTGGGSGGHITPILAVASELKRQQPTARIVYIGQRGDALADLPATDPNIDEVRTISAGKFRRYHGEGWHQLLDLRTQFLNVRDGYRTLAGLWQSYRLMGQIKPSVIFTRGGFVSVPVALAGKLRGVPYITHDSDSIPSLANRIIARWATQHAVALPKELYPYPASKTITVGIPLSNNYQPLTHELRQQYRHELGIPLDAQVVMVTGGGNGAENLNMTLVANVPALLKHFPRLVVLHLTGRALEGSTAAAYNTAVQGDDRHRVRVIGFATDLYRYSGSADIVIARGGATNLAEFATQGIACIIIPSKQLLWNVKNSEALSKRQAIVELTEDAAEQELRLAHVISDLLDDDSKRTELAKRLAAYAHPDAAAETAKLILGTGSA